MSVLREAYERLFNTYGAQGWWPALSKDARRAQAEVVIGAVLVQNTAWRNVECVIERLQNAELLDLERLYALPESELQTLIRSAGYYRIKATRLRNLLQLIFEEHGSLDQLFTLPTEELREALLSVSGVGPETADAILLYAAGRPRFVIDAYTRRVVERHGWSEELSYDALQQQFESELVRDAALFNEYHALLVEVGKRHCGVKAKCVGCPLELMLQENTEPRS